MSEVEQPSTKLRSRYTVIYPVQNNTRVFFGVPINKYAAQFKNYTTARMHSESFFHPKTPYETTISIILFTMYYFTAINIFLTLHYGINLKFHNYFTHTLPNTAGSESFTESHPILRKYKFTTEPLTYDNFLFLTDNATHTRFIIRPTIIISVFFHLLLFPRLLHLKYPPKKSRIKTHCESPSPQNLDHW